MPPTSGATTWTPSRKGSVLEAGRVMMAWSGAQATEETVRTVEQSVERSQMSSPERKKQANAREYAAWRTSLPRSKRLGRVLTVSKMRRRSGRVIGSFAPVLAAPWRCL